MSPQQKVVNVLRREIPYLQENYGVKKIALFGSVVHGGYAKHSDIDMVVDFTQPSFDNFMGLADYLERLFKKKVDILTPAGVKGIRVKSVAKSIKKSLIYV